MEGPSQVRVVPRSDWQREAVSVTLACACIALLILDGCTAYSRWLHCLLMMAALLTRWLHCTALLTRCAYRLEDHRQEAYATLRRDVLLNIAACSLPLQLWKKAEYTCTAAMDIDPANLKGLLRRSRARAALSLFEEARSSSSSSASTSTLHNRSCLHLRLHHSWGVRLL